MTPITPHIKAQAIRVARLFAVALLAQLATTGTANIGWKTLAAIGVGAIEAVVRQIWPTSSAPQVKPVASQPTVGEASSARRGGETEHHPDRMPASVRGGVRCSVPPSKVSVR